MAITLFLPLFMLFTFWISTRWDDPSEFDLMRYMYPAIVAISIMLTGQTLATRLNSWREQNIFQRLILTSVNLTHIMLGMTITQIIMGIIQGLAILIIGIFLLQIHISFLSFFSILGVIIITGLTFSAYGIFIATFTKKSELTGYVFFFSLLPLYFLASFPTEMLPPSIQIILPWLPTWMSIELIESAIYAQAFPPNGVFMILGLVIYITIFALVSSRFFNWKD
ncbi:MAG: ABC transporter permease [Candidatus Thorarchaeota archaeon]